MRFRPSTGTPSFASSRSPSRRLFMTVMLNNVSPMAVHGVLAVNTEQLMQNEALRRIDVSAAMRLNAFVFALVSEVITWVGVISVGIQFILVSRTVVEVMRSTVSIVFVLNIDEVVFQVSAQLALRAHLPRPPCSFRALCAFYVLRDIYVFVASANRWITVTAPEHVKRATGLGVLLAASKALRCHVRSRVNSNSTAPLTRNPRPRTFSPVPYVPINPLLLLAPQACASAELKTLVQEVTFQIGDRRHTMLGHTFRQLAQRQSFWRTYLHLPFFLNNEQEIENRMIRTVTGHP